MAVVRLRFVPPDIENLSSLAIFESASANGPFDLIDETTAIGTYHNYIEEYETTLALMPDDWFAIQWRDAVGDLSPLSVPVRGGEDTLIGQVVKRVLQRDRTLDQRIVSQEAEAVIERYMGVDPYTTYSPALYTYNQLSGLTYLVLARSMIVRSIQSSEMQSATMGLVSFKAGTSSAFQKDVQALIDMANKYLGVATSVVLTLDDTVEAVFINYDHSRLVSGWLTIE